MRRRLSSACFALLLGLPAPLLGQPEAAPRPEPQGLRSLRSRFGIEAVRPWLRAEPTLLRQRAFERLGALGTSTAIELLAGALATGGEARDARERLVVVRSLAAHTNEESAVVALVRALGSGSGRDDPKETLVEHTAALALARAKNPRAAKALFQALRQTGRVAATARLALRAYPPRDIDALLAAPGAPTLELLELLGELGNGRAAEFTANLVRGGNPALRGAALVALSRLDRPRALALSRGLVRAEPNSELGLAATGVLAAADDPELPRLLDALFRVPERRSDALEMALEAPSVEIGTVLSRLQPAAGEFERVAAALGRAGGSSARTRLESWLGDPARGWAAAYALALADAGQSPLERALDRDGSRRVALLGLALGATALGKRPSSHGAITARLFASKVEADRAAAAFAIALADPERAAELVAGRDLAVVRAIARAGLDPLIAKALAARLPGETDRRLRAALSLCLAVPDAADAVPTETLVELVESDGAAAALAVYALAARDGETLRPLVRDLLASADPNLRSHVALGLARSVEASAVGMLADAYRFEPEARVRRAIVRTLAARTEPGREPTLRLARELDPDDTARKLARAALDPHQSAAAPDAHGTVWLRLTPSTPASSTPLALIELSNGLMLPAAADADGNVTLAHLPPGPIDVTFASALPGAAP